MHKRLHSGRRAPPPTLPRRRSQGFEVLGRVTGHYFDELRWTSASRSASGATEKAVGKRRRSETETCLVLTSRPRNIGSRIVRRSASPLRHGHCNKERGNGRDSRDQDADRTKHAGGREREQNRESGGVRGGDAGGYRRDDKGRKDGGSDAHGRHTDCYGDRREETFRVGTAEALAGTFKAQNVANTLWAYATMGREPGAGVMRELEGRAEALAGTFNAQDVVNTLWGVCVIALLCAPGQGRRWLLCLAHTARQRLVTLGKVARFNTAQLRQFHQFFVGCSVEPRLRMEAINDIGALKETFREAFE